MTRMITWLLAAAYFHWRPIGGVLAAVLWTAGLMYVVDVRDPVAWYMGMSAAAFWGLLGGMIPHVGLPEREWEDFKKHFKAEEDHGQ